MAVSTEELALVEVLRKQAEDLSPKDDLTMIVVEVENQC